MAHPPPTVLRSVRPARGDASIPVLFRGYALAMAIAMSHLVAASPAVGQIESRGKLTFVGPLEKEEDLSAIAILGRALLVGSDEGTKVQVLEEDPGDDSIYHVRPDLDITLLQSTTELDIEGIAQFKDTDIYYVAGSHSLKRKLLKPDATKEQNLASLEEVILEPSRFNIFRLEMDKRTLRPKNVESIGLYSLLGQDPVLQRFTQIPSKENGVDIEGVAVKGKEGDKLHLGFRGPVLRDNLVPIMVLDFNRPEKYELLYLDLGGLGIREFVKVKDGFLIIAGPSGDGPGDFQIYFWDGDDGIPDRGKRKSKLRFLGKLPTPAGAKAEGMVVEEETDKRYDVIVVYDGVVGGMPERFRIRKSWKD